MREITTLKQASRRDTVPLGTQPTLVLRLLHKYVYKSVCVICKHLHTGHKRSIE